MNFDFWDIWNMAPLSLNLIDHYKAHTGLRKKYNNFSMTPEINDFDKNTK